MSQEKKEIVVGNLVSVSNSIDGGRWLGLIVNQEAAQKWVEKDLCIEYNPPEKQGFLIARVLGGGLILSKPGLPETEPDERQTVRWVFVQLNQAYVVAGPDVVSVENFLSQCRICNLLGMRGATFFHDLALVAEYLRGVTRKRSEMSSFESKYFKMLGEVLPK